MRRSEGCCKHTKKAQTCKRRSDKKVFRLPRRFSRKKCLSRSIRGFSMRSSCAPYIGCKKTRRRIRNSMKVKI